MTYKRRRGAAIIQTPKGILLVNERGKFILPGGKAERGESRRIAVLREVMEETQMSPMSSEFLFKHTGVKKKLRRGGEFRDYAKVFLVKAKGEPKPSREVTKLAFYNENKKLPLDKDTKNILGRFLKK